MLYEEYINARKLLSLEKIKSLPTPRLLAYFKKYKVQDYANVCWCGCGEKNTGHTDKFLTRYIDDLREELNKREHVEKRYRKKGDLYE